MKKLICIFFAVALLCGTTALATSTPAPSTEAALPIFYPETELKDAPMVVRYITSRQQLEAIKDDPAPPQYALFTIASVRDNIMVTIDGSSFTVEDIFTACNGKTVPVFNISNVQPSAPGNLCAIAKEKGYKNFMVISTEHVTLDKIDVEGAKLGLIMESVDDLDTCPMLDNLKPFHFIVVPDATAEQVTAAKAASLDVFLWQNDAQSGSAMQKAMDVKARYVAVADHTEAYDALPPLPFAEPPHTPDLPVISYLGLTHLLVPVAAVLLFGSVLIAIFHRKRRS